MYSSSSLIRTLLPNDNPSNQCKFSDSWDSKISLSREATPFIRPLFRCRNADLIRGGLLYIFMINLILYGDTCYTFCKIIHKLKDILFTDNLFFKQTFHVKVFRHLNYNFSMQYNIYIYISTINHYSNLNCQQLFCKISLVFVDFQKFRVEKIICIVRILWLKVISCSSCLLKSAIFFNIINLIFLVVVTRFPSPLKESVMCICKIISQSWKNKFYMAHKKMTEDQVGFSDENIVPCGSVRPNVINCSHLVGLLVMTCRWACYEFWISLWKIALCLVILLLPLYAAILVILLNFENTVEGIPLLI